MHRSPLLKELKERFPEIVPDLNAQDGLLSFELEVFSRYTQRQIDFGDRGQVEACFELAQRSYLAGNAKMKDAIDTCFVETLNFADSKKTARRWAWDCFPEVLKELHIRFHSQFGKWSPQPKK